MIQSIVARLLALCFATSSGLATYVWRFRSKPIIKLFLLLMLCYIQASLLGIMIISDPGSRGLKPKITASPGHHLKPFAIKRGL